MKLFGLYIFYIETIKILWKSTVYYLAISKQTAIL
jgi:uncharacterized membrane protein YobD (UPF0266 family)